MGDSMPASAEFLLCIDASHIVPPGFLGVPANVEEIVSESNPGRAAMLGIVRCDGGRCDREYPRHSRRGRPSRYKHCCASQLSGQFNTDMFRGFAEAVSYARTHQPDNCDSARQEMRDAQTLLEQLAALETQRDPYAPELATERAQLQQRRVAGYGSIQPSIEDLLRGGCQRCGCNRSCVGCVECTQRRCRAIGRGLWLAGGISYAMQRQHAGT